MADAKVNIQDAAARVTLTVKIIGRRRFWSRTKVGLWLIWLGARVIGVGLELQAPASEPGGPPAPPPDREQLIGG